MLKNFILDLRRGAHLFIVLLMIVHASNCGAITDKYPPVQFIEIEVSHWLSDSSDLKLNRSLAGIDYTDSIFYQLTPTLSVVTRPIGQQKNNVNFAVYSASVQVYQVTLTQASPFVTCPYEIVLGNDTVEKGMKLILQVPSQLQPGSIFMQATFSSLNTPSTKISAQVATWNL